MRPIVLLFFMYAMFTTKVAAQMNLEVSTDFLVGPKMHSGLPIAVYDINNDLLDDLIFLDQGTVLYVAHQNWNSESFLPFLIDTVGRDPQWAMAIADLDKNGDPDIVIGGAYDHVKIFFQEDGDFTKVILNSPDVYVQSLNIVDIDGNGWLDIFLSNDIGYNEVWWNDVTGFKKDDTGLFTDLPEPVSKGNYGAEWIDIEGDGDMDLYIAKCHPDAQAGDLRRTNRLYINNGLGQFTEEASLRGIASEAQSWTGHFFDSDNDGDFDLLVTNHDQNAQLYLNDGNGYFTENTIDSRLTIYGPVIQSLDADLNLDGNPDLIIGGIPDFLYLGGEDEAFEDAGEHLGLYDLTSLAVGDLNNDGIYDVYSTVLDLINLPSPMEDRILFNRTKRNFLNIYLQDRGGPVSIQGAIAKVYVGDEVMTRIIRSGESYGIQNSSKMMFGLGEREEVDSIQVLWSNGYRQSLTQMPANQYVVFHSSGRIVKQSDYHVRTRDTLCHEETTRLEAPVGAFVYRWNTSETSRAITVEEAGYYQVDMIYGDGAVIRLPGISIYKDIVFSKELSLMGDSVICHGETASLFHADGLDVSWSTGEESQSIQVDATGWYSGKKNHPCDDGPLDSTYIRVLPDISNFRVLGDSVKKGEDATLKSSSSFTKWYSDSLSLNPDFIGPELVLQNVLKDTQVYCSIFETYHPDTLYGGLPKSDDLYMHTEDLNATMIFDVITNCTLHSVRIWTDLSGSRKVMLYDQNVTLRDSQIVDLDTGWNEVILDFALIPSDGRYRLTTDNDHNRIQLGMRSPRIGSTQEVNYPLINEGVLRIIESQYGRDQYNYFFDWKIILDPKTCDGKRLPVDVVVEASTGVDGQTIAEVVEIFPNPSGGDFIVRSNVVLGQVVLRDLHGNEIQTVNKGIDVDFGHEYHYSIYENGVYILSWRGGQQRVVIMN